jgi:drug/metabolite transporter (DMT)-like permease
VTDGVLRGLDPLALLAAVISVAMAVVYVQVVRGQDEQPLVWVLIVLVTSAVLAAYGAWLGAPHRRVGLIVAGVGLVLLGLLAILSIGLPILVAGALAIWGSSRPSRASYRPR